LSNTINNSINRKVKMVQKLATKDEILYIHLKKGKEQSSKRITYRLEQLTNTNYIGTRWLGSYSETKSEKLVAGDSLAIPPSTNEVLKNFYMPDKTSVPFESRLL
jgi:hypothetical protein